MTYQINFTNYVSLSVDNREELIDALNELTDLDVADILRIHSDGATVSVMDIYHKYIGTATGRDGGRSKEEINMERNYMYALLAVWWPEVTANVLRGLQRLGKDMPLIMAKKNPQQVRTARESNEFKKKHYVSNITDFKENCKHDYDRSA